MTKKRNVPEVRFKGFTNVWDVKRLGDCLLVQRGGSPRPIENFITTNPNGINWIKIGDVAVGSRYITSTQEKIIPEGEQYSRKVFKGDLILSNSMSFGRPYIMQIDGCIHDGWLLIRDEKKKFNLEYLLQLLSSDYMLKQYKMKASGGVVINLNSELVQSTDILIPREEEQIKLGNHFKEIDQLISYHSKKYEKLLNVKKAMLEKMFPKDGADLPEIRFKDFTKPWSKKIMQDVGCFKNGMNFGKEALGHGYPFVNLQDVFGKNFVKGESLGLAESNEAQRKTYDLKSGDVLFIRSSVKPEGVGEAAVIYENLINTTYSGFIIRFRADIRMSLSYSRFAYSIKPIRKQILSGATSSANTNINQDSLSKIVVFLPDYNEQEKIGFYFEKLDDLISLQSQELEKLKNVKKAMLEKMFV